MSKPLTQTQRAALRALDEAGGEGVITKTGTLLAAGEELGDGMPSPQAYHSVTWLRLVAAELVVGAGNDRLRLTLLGKHEARR